MRRKILSLICLFIILSIFLPVVFAQVPPPTDPITLLTEGIRKVFSFSWATSEENFLATMRLFVWFFLFIVYQAVFRMLGNLNPNMGWLAQRAGIGLAIIIASISVLFMPTQILIGMGVQYGELAAILLFAPIFGAAIWLILSTQNHWVRFFLILTLIYILWWIAYQFNLVKSYYGGITGGARFIILPILPLLFERLMKKWQML